MYIECPQCKLNIDVNRDVMGMKGRCPECGIVFTITEHNETPTPPDPASPSPPPPPQNNTPIKTTSVSDQPGSAFWLGLAGSIILFIGVFMPLVSVPIAGNINYIGNGKGDGIVVLILAVVSLLFVLTKKYKGLWLTGLGSLGMMLFTFINFQSKLSQAKTDVQSELAGNPFRDVADAAIESVHLQWGWAILLVGAALVIASPVMARKH